MPHSTCSYRLVLPVISRPAKVLGDGWRARGDRTTVSERTQVLGRIEAPGCGRRHPAHRALLGERTVRLGAVFDDPPPPRGSEGGDLLHVARIAKEVDGHDGSGSRRCQVADLGEVHQTGLWVDVHEHRNGARLGDPNARRIGRDRRDDHTRSSLDSGRSQGKGDGVGAVGNPNGEIGPDESGKLPFEGLDLSAADQVAALEDPSDGAVDLNARPEVGRISGRQMEPTSSDRRPREPASAQEGVIFSEVVGLIVGSRRQDEADASRGEVASLRPDHGGYVHADPRTIQGVGDGRRAVVEAKTSTRPRPG